MRCLASGGGGEGGCWGCIERPSYIHLSPPTHSPPSLFRRSSRPPAPFQPSLSLPPPPPPSPPTALPPSLPHLPPAQPLAHPSRLTYLNPLSSVSSRRHPFLNPDTLPPPFSFVIPIACSSQDLQESENTRRDGSGGGGPVIYNAITLVFTAVSNQGDNLVTN
ncbi:hypothetical protein ALC53_04794 [Atta colombica]|uniref:Uncharacterized protein n=1 Tax=Atta colombica TaxID=520822 RepID=A0A195BIT7_9HYME|nr:hypothetical protein ALC53_04794 [Atta colombica]